MWTLSKEHSKLNYRNSKYQQQSIVLGIFGWENGKLKVKSPKSPDATSRNRFPFSIGRTKWEVAEGGRGRAGRWPCFLSPLPTLNLPVDGCQKILLMSFRNCPRLVLPPPWWKQDLMQISLTSFQNTKRVPLMMMSADMKIFRIRDLLRMVSVMHLGGCLMVSLSTGSTPKLPPREAEGCVN